MSFNEKRTKHYVEMVFGNFASGRVLEIQEREDPKKVQLPEGAIGFRFFDRGVITFDGETYTGEPKNISGLYVWGEKMTQEEFAEKAGPERQEDVNFFRTSHIREVLELNNGKVIPYREDMIIL